MGNIISWANGNKTITYVYDLMGQLIRVNDPTDPSSGSSGTTWTFEYDRGGNILNKKRYAYTTGTLGTEEETIAYGYDATWKDKLVSYNGTPITYDAIGNPLNDGTWTYTWENGRQLKQMSSADTTAVFAYDHDGLRVRKTVNNVVTNYTLHGKNIVHMTRGDDILHFFYDAANRPAVVVFNGTKYGYVHNLQGDICRIIDANGTAVVQYKYDSWGKVLSTTGSLASTLGTIQPFRYRGYVYDVETGLYYLRSRYYSCTWQRFLNIDTIINNHNIFCYCLNNPTCLYDTNGKDPDWVHRQAIEHEKLIPVDAMKIHSDSEGTTYTPGYDVFFNDYYDAEAAKRMNVYSSRSTNSEVLVADIRKHAFMFAKTIDNDYEWLEVIFVYENGLLCRQGYAKADDVYIKNSGGTVYCKGYTNDKPVNVRVQPKYSKIKYQVEQDTNVSVIGYKDGYYWISTEQGCGWMDSDYLFFS